MGPFLFFMRLGVYCFGDRFMWKITDKPLDYYIRGVHQDIFINFLNVHDEEDFIVDENVMKPLLVKFNSLSELKPLFEAICGLPFIVFLFDNEFDSTKSFTASEAFNPYEYRVKVSEWRLKQAKKFSGDKGVMLRVSVPKDLCNQSFFNLFKSFLDQASPGERVRVALSLSLGGKLVEADMDIPSIDKDSLKEFFSGCVVEESVL